MTNKPSPKTTNRQTTAQGAVPPQAVNPLRPNPFTTNRTSGLTKEEAALRLQQFGKNCLVPEKQESPLKKLLSILCEPMFLLLIAAAVIYFILGEPRDGAIMLVFVLGIIGIEVVQEWKTDQTLNALKELSAPHVLVLRDGAEQQILSADLVPGDIMLIHEGVKIPADGFVIRCSDLCVDESSLTGEALGVWKLLCESQQATDEDYWRRDYCYGGTLVTQGSATILVDKTGAETEYGKIGQNVSEAPEEMTPLQKQTGKLVTLCAWIAAVLFVLVAAFSFMNLVHLPFKERIIAAILSGITLSMAMIPEEFPVILTVFLSMGAWRLAKKQSLVRRLPSVETLGAVSVLCVDKTGTITMNKMAVEALVCLTEDEEQLCEVMGLGCETDAYDPMEKAMLDYCAQRGITRDHLFAGELITEYSFTNELKMMGHVWAHDGQRLIAAKGSAEHVLTLCAMDSDTKAQVEAKIKALSSKGLRVIAVAIQQLGAQEEPPAEITACSLTLLGLVGLADPPRAGVAQDIAKCVAAGIRVVMITGDNGITASAIAQKVGIPNCTDIVTGDMLNTMTDVELQQRVQTVSIFSRVIPEHKMRIVQAFRENGEIVAMTGDGVNDAPALKYAHIGIAMGKRGSEVSREAADLILLDDNFSTIVQTVHDGRRIYDNIRKAVGYVFSIHIPIALASLFAPMMGILPEALPLLPLHVVLLELIIDPTCSIVLERQPAERDLMQRPPRNTQETLITAKNLSKSVLQGLTIFAASFGLYFVCLLQESGAQVGRSMLLATLMLSNLLLVQVNSSELDSMFTSMRRLANDKVMWSVNAVTLLGLLIILYSPLNQFLKLSPLSLLQLVVCVAAACAAVLWYELVKLAKRAKICYK